MLAAQATAFSATKAEIGDFRVEVLGRGEIVRDVALYGPIDVGSSP